MEACFHLGGKKVRCPRPARANPHPLEVHLDLRRVKGKHWVGEEERWLSSQTLRSQPLGPQEYRDWFGSAEPSSPDSGPTPCSRLRGRVPGRVWAVPTRLGPSSSGF